METSQSASQVLTISEVMEYLQIGRSHAYQLVAEGKIPSIRLGRKIVIPRKRLEKLLDGEGGTGEQQVI